MCTLIVATRAWDDTPLLVAANRDERLDRPADPPRIWDGIEHPIPLLAPRDRSAGGTWIGLSANGLFAGLTNRYGTPPDPKRRSRGEIVLLALREAGAAKAAARVAAIDPAAHNPFHLVVADRGCAFLLVNTSESMTKVELAPGIHIATERSFNTETTAREQLIRARLFPLDRPPDDATLQALLATHGVPAIDGVCVHAPEFNYGTRSASIIRLTRTGESFLHAEGTPCINPFRSAELPA